jgi:hypothetical protein
MYDPVSSLALDVQCIPRDRKQTSQKYPSSPFPIPRSLPASPKTHAEAGLTGECEISALPVYWDRPVSRRPFRISHYAHRAPPIALVCVFARLGRSRTTGQFVAKALLLRTATATPGPPKGPPPFGVNCHSFIPFLGTAQRRWTRSLRWRLTWLCNVSSLESLGFPRTRIKSYRRHRNAKRDFPSSFPSFAIAPVCLLFTQWLAQLPRLLFP